MSFLESEHIEVTDVEWREDDLGDYWHGKFYDKQTGDRGVTGTYYHVCEDGLRPSRERQEKELESYGVKEAGA